MRAAASRGVLATLATLGMYGVVLAFVGSGAFGAGVCSNEAVRGGVSAHLPDCRAYELVTPVEKNGGYISQGAFSAAPGGESVGFTSISGFAGATSDLNTATGYQTSRSASGWSTKAETQSEAQFIDHHSLLSKDFFDESFGNNETFRKAASPECGSAPVAVAADCGLEGGVRLWDLQGVLEPESSLAFYRTGVDGVNVEIGPAVPPTASGLAQSRNIVRETEEINVLGWSADTTHMVFEDPEPEGTNQWSFGSPGALLEYAGTGNTTPMLVGVNDSGGFVNNCPRQLLGGTAEYRNINNPISTDGSAVFFTDACQGELFARIDNGEPGARTVAISEPGVAECAVCDTEPAVRTGAQFLGASEDGSRVFFYTAQPLLGGSGGLYEYDFSATGERVIRVAPGSLPPMSGESGGASALVSQDGSHVYFLSKAVLTERPSPNVQGLDGEHKPVTAGAVAQPGLNNLYVYEHDSAYPKGHLAFVADLANHDTEGEPRYAVTPDGRFLVLNVVSELTSDDTAEVPQVFEYDSATGSMVRVSRGEDGYNGNGNGIAALIPRKVGGETTFNPSSYFSTLSVSADGAYVFFQSGDGLTPEALNKVVVGIGREHGPPETDYAQNVYEYHAGEISLISDGQDTSTHLQVSQVHLLSTDLSGRDVFFVTTDQLVAQDTDSNKDIYDARIEGGFPSPPEPVSCTGDSCQGLLSSAPVLLSPGSEFQAGGNPTTAVKQTAKKTTSKPKPKAKKKTALKHKKNKKSNKATTRHHR